MKNRGECIEGKSWEIWIFTCWNRSVSPCSILSTFLDKCKKFMHTRIIHYSNTLENYDFSSGGKKKQGNNNSFSFYLNFETTNFAWCLIVSISTCNHNSSYWHLTRYLVWRATCSAGPRLFLIFDNYNEDNKKVMGCSGGAQHWRINDNKILDRVSLCGAKGVRQELKQWQKVLGHSVRSVWQRI